MKTIGIVGSRRRDTAEDYFAVFAALTKIYQPGDTLVSGGCPKGADRFAENLADRFGIPIKIYRPDLSKLDKQLPYRVGYTKIAYARNELIAKDANILIACVAEDRKGGTEHTIKCFFKLGKRNVMLV